MALCGGPAVPLAQSELGCPVRCTLRQAILEASMERALTFLLVVAVVLVTSQRLSSEQGWSRYQEATLANVTADNNYLMEGDYSVVGKAFPLKVKMGYTGEIREINPDKKHLIEMWVKSFSVDPKIAERFQKEILFLENGTMYWLPVQTELIPAFQEELKTGDCIWLFVQLWGSAKKQFVFVVNEFQAIPGTKCPN